MSIHSLPEVGQVDLTARWSFPRLVEIQNDPNIDVLQTPEEVTVAIGKLNQTNDPFVAADYYATAEAAIATLSQQDIELLENRGIITTWFSKEYPLGSYAKDRFPSNDQLLAGEQQQLPTEPTDIVRFNRPFLILVAPEAQPKNVFSIHTKKPATKTAAEISNAGFENFTTSAKVAAIAFKNSAAVWQWQPSQIFPDGDQQVDALTASDQYGSSGFEGGVAMVDDQGQIQLFRVEENAKRLQKTCQAIGMPPLPVEQYIASVEAFVAANYQYMPPVGSKAKFYIRPFIKALDGGYGVGQGKAYLFCVEGFPFGEYIAKRSDIIDIVQVPNAHRSHLGGTGDIKSAGNYAQSVGHKNMAKSGQLPGYNGQKFHDIFYMGAATETGQDINGDTITVQKSVLDEAGSSNVFFLTEDNGQITLHTPSLTRQSILPGITRDSIIQIASHFNYQVIEADFTQAQIIQLAAQNATAFVSGSAAGAVRVGSMTFIDQKAEFNCEEEAAAAPATTIAFFRIYDALYALRQGQAKSYLNGTFQDTAMATWATQISC